MMRWCCSMAMLRPLTTTTTEPPAFWSRVIQHDAAKKACDLGNQGACEAAK